MAIKRVAAYEVPCYRVVWTTVQGVEVKTIPGLGIVAVPNPGRRNSARFDVVDIKRKKLLCQLPKAEVCEWLDSAARAKGLPFNSTFTTTYQEVC